MLQTRTNRIRLLIAEHRALVIVCAGERPGLGLLNAERFRNPSRAPAIHVSSEASEAVLFAAAGAKHARVVSESRYVRASDNQLHCARVLEVRIQSPPPGESANFWFL